MISLLSAAVFVGTAQAANPCDQQPIGSAEARLVGPAGSGAGSAVAGADLDGDGQSEIAVGASAAGLAAGAVYIVSNPGGNVDLQDEAVWLGAAPGDKAGHALALHARWGLAVGAPSASDNTGVAYLVAAPLAGGRLDDAVSFEGLAADAYVGLSVALASDGFAVGGPGDTGVGGNAGAAWLYGVPWGGEAPRAEVEAAEAGDRLGWSVAVGPLTEAAGALAVGLPRRDGGTVAVFDAPAGATGLSDAVWTLHGEGAAGWALAAAGDVNGDGWVDLLVGAPEYQGSRGAAFLFLGPLAGTATLADAAAVLVGELGGDQAGFAVAGAGDLNRDGFDDLIVGAPWALGGAGTAYVVLGPVFSELPLERADGRWSGVGSAAVGWSVAGAGDVSGDGVDDLVIGAPGWSDGDGGLGAAFLLQGDEDGCPVVTDADRDGVAAGVDCDDTDATAAFPRTFYLDGDGDGFGVQTAPVTGCQLPDGAASLSGDCADADPDRYPGAAELCDGIDQDCDGVTDDGCVPDTAGDNGGPVERGACGCEGRGIGGKFGLVVLLPLARRRRRRAGPWTR